VDLLKRELAPILDEAWRLIDAGARQALELHLAGRRLVDVSGPHGWEFAAVNTGELDLVDWQPVEEVHAGMRRVLPLLEVRTPVELKLLDLDEVGRGHHAPELAPVAQAADRMARTEDGAIFHGQEEAGIQGILPTSPHDPVHVADTADYPHAIRTAMTQLARAGVNGPYALVLGTAAYDEVFAAVESGYPIARQLANQVLDGPIVHAQVLDGGAVLSLRGGDYELTIGQDLSVGYVFHDRDRVELFLAESFTFRVLEPAAAVRLTRGG
jgi:uncharacterized linocin/CFP29 family protein